MVPAAAAAAGAAGAGGRRAGAGGGAQGRPAGASSPSRHPYLRSFSSSENGLLALVDLWQRCHTRSTALKAALRVPHPLALMIRTEYCRRQHRVFSSSASSILIIRIEYSHHQHRVLSSSASSSAVIHVDRLHSWSQAPPQRRALTGAGDGSLPGAGAARLRSVAALPHRSAWVCDGGVCLSGVLTVGSLAGAVAAVPATAVC